MAEARQRVSALITNRTHCLPTPCNQSYPLSPRFVSIAWKKRYMTRHISPPATKFLAYRTVVLGFFNLNIKARYKKREFLNKNLWLRHLIAFDIDWSWNIVTESRPVNADHYIAFKHRISFATGLAANLGCDRFRITPDIVSKLLRAAIWSRCAVRFESEQIPFPRTGRPCRTAALHRIRFWICGFVPMSYFCSETNEW